MELTKKITTFATEQKAFVDMKKFKGILFVCLLLATVISVSSCATKTRIEYRDRDVNHYITQYIHDTLRIESSDSIHHEIKVVNDTVYDTKYVEKTRWRDRIVVKHDTCYKDSTVTITNKTTIEKKIIPKWCYISLAICLVFIIISNKKFVRWLIKI